VTKNTIPDPGPGDVAARVAARTMAKRGADYASEVRRLLDAALTVIERQGTSGKARVADIVAAAGLSNDAFYRHFPSKDALVAALVEDGTLRLASYVAHQMDKEPDPEGKVRRWVEAILSQADGKAATATLAVLGNGSSFDRNVAPNGDNPSAPLAALLHGPFAALGSTDPELDASLAAHAVVGRLPEYLWARTHPTPAEVDHIVRFCTEAARPRN
jgi:AcrR family transcriptional regulator